MSAPLQTSEEILLPGCVYLQRSHHHHLDGTVEEGDSLWKQRKLEDGSRRSHGSVGRNWSSDLHESELFQPLHDDGEDDWEGRRGGRRG